MKVHIKILMITVFLLCCLNITGCVSFPKNYNTDAEPIYPELGSTIMKHYQVIDTLEPELRWKDIKSEGQTYDVCIWETSSDEQGEFFRGVPFVPRSWGKQIYYAEGISDNYYKVNKPLKPNTYYHWSVRTRKGTNVSEWGSFSQNTIGLFVVGNVSNAPYGFITPQK
jgi:hypothetical protein